MADIKVTRGRGDVYLFEPVSSTGKTRLYSILSCSYPIIPIDKEYVDEVIYALRLEGLIVDDV